MEIIHRPHYKTTWANCQIGGITMEVKVDIVNKDGAKESYKYGAQDKYDKSNTVQIKMKLNRKTDADIISWLEQQSSKQGAIKALIREKLNK